jgi:hypothetical protein
MKKILLATLIAGILMMSGCTTIPNADQTSQNKEQKIMEDNQQQLIDTAPAPSLTKSLERENIANRLKLLNDDSKVFYVYLIDYGKIMGFYTAKGKVSSLNSFMTPMQRIIKDANCANDFSSTDRSGGCYFVVDAPDQDGSYGMNDNGVFFFTTEGAYVEWHGDYLVSDQALKLSEPVAMVMEIKDKKQ